MIISKRELKNEQLKVKLLSALESIVAKYGYDQVNIRAICKISGVSYGSFYNLFENKDKLPNSRNPFILKMRRLKTNYLWKK